MIIENFEYVKGNYKITLDNGEYIYILEDTVVDFNINVGLSLDEVEFERLKYLDRVNRGLEISYRYLRNLKTAFQVKQHLFEKGFTDVSEEVVEILQQKNYLDDLEYARLFTKDRLEINGDGKNKILSMLLQKGVASEIAKTAIGEIDLCLEYENAKKIALKKFPTLVGKKNQREKLIRYMVGKGFDFETIKDVLEELEL